MTMQPSPTPTPPSPHLTGSNPADWRRKFPRSQFKPAMIGICALVLFVGSFGVWATMAPLSGAVIAPGVVQVSGQNQIVDHLEGGIVKTIHVGEGDRVTEGDRLISLQTVRIETDLNRNRSALILAQAEFQRALAERDGVSKLTLPAELQGRADRYGLSSDIEQQVSEFESRLARHTAQLEALARRVDAMEEQIAGLEVQRRAEAEKLEIIVNELTDKEALLEKGLTSRNEVNALRRARVDSTGRIGALQSSIAERRTSIAELEQQRQTIIASRQEEAATRVNALRSTIADLSEQMIARADMLDRAEITAPVSGIVVRMHANTVGGVIRAGEPIVEIVPGDAANIVEARIGPNDADAVHVGQAARLRLVALNTRTTPEVPAIVEYVSADRIVDPVTGEPYYTARLSADEAFIAEKEIPALQTGTPVEAMIVTEDRTFLAYLLRPITDSMARAFREE